MTLRRLWLQKHANGIYYRAWRDERNQKQRRSLRTRKKAVADLLLANYRRECEDDLRAGIDGPCPTLTEFIPVYLNHITSRKAPGWVRSQRLYLTKFAKLWGDLKLRDIKVWMILDFQSESAKRVKNNTTEKKMACLRKLFKVAIQRGFVRVNPAGAVERLKDDTEIREETISPDEYARLLSCSFLPRLRIFVVLAYHLGARPVELLRLAKSDFDSERRQVLIRGAKDHAKLVKIRYLPYDDEVERELADYEQLLDPAAKYLFENDGEPGWSSLDATFRRAAKKAGLLLAGRQITPMTLRHTFGVRHAEQGITMRDLSYRMGHGSERTTEKWYARFTPEYAKR